MTGAVDWQVRVDNIGHADCIHEINAEAGSPVVITINQDNQTLCISLEEFPENQKRLFTIEGITHMRVDELGGGGG